MLQIACIKRNLRAEMHDDVGLLGVTRHTVSCRLVFIGRNLDADELNASFRDCLIDNLAISG